MHRPAGLGGPDRPGTFIPRRRLQLALPVARRLGAELGSSIGAWSSPNSEFQTTAMYYIRSLNVGLGLKGCCSSAVHACFSNNPYIPAPISNSFLGLISIST